MATEKKTVWLTLDTQVYYSQVFEGNRDNGDMHAETDGVYKTTMRVSDEQIQQLIDLGVPEVQLGYQTFKDSTIDGESFKTYAVKRPHLSKYLKDETTGDAQVMGPPLIFDLNKALEAYNEAGAIGWIKPEFKTPWEMSDGLIGNGTTAKVKMSIYRGKNKAGKPTCMVNLEEIAIVDLVPYAGSGEVRF